VPIPVLRMALAADSYHLIIADDILFLHLHHGCTVLALLLDFRLLAGVLPERQEDVDARALQVREGDFVVSAAQDHGEEIRQGRQDDDGAEDELLDSGQAEGIQHAAEDENSVARVFILFLQYPPNTLETA